MNSTKFIACVLGLLIIAFKDVTSDMVMALTVVIGGYYGANGYITSTALKKNGHTNGSGAQ